MSLTSAEKLLNFLLEMKRLFQQIRYRPQNKLTVVSLKYIFYVPIFALRMLFYASDFLARIALNWNNTTSSKMLIGFWTRIFLFPRWKDLLKLSISFAVFHFLYSNLKYFSLFELFITTNVISQFITSSHLTLYLAI